MKKTNLVLLALLSLISFASAHTGNDNDISHSMMGGMMSGMSFMWMFGWLFMILIIVALILLIVWLIKQIQKK